VTDHGIELNHVSKSYGSVLALNDLTFDIPVGGRFALLGPNGAGKSTTLKLLIGSLRADTGSVKILGSGPESPASKAVVGYLPEDALPYRMLSVRENLEYIAALRGVDDVKGRTDYLLDELERAVIDGTRVVMDAMEDGTFVVGGAAVETELLMKIRDYAATVGGRVQIAIEAYAAAFESIPRTLAENSGFNPIDKLVELKNAHAKGKKNGGLNVYTGTVVDMLADGVVEPLRSKRQSIQSASETAVMLIRVDDMMITQSKAPAGGAPPAM
jgi:ABC-type sugar transport system ATPase subunit